LTIAAQHPAGMRVHHCSRAVQRGSRVAAERTRPSLRHRFNPEAGERGAGRANERPSITWLRHKQAGSGNGPRGKSWHRVVQPCDLGRPLPFTFSVSRFTSHVARNARPAVLQLPLPSAPAPATLRRWLLRPLT
jgi:hypothetical protein